MQYTENNYSGLQSDHRDLKNTLYSETICDSFPQELKRWKDLTLNIQVCRSHLFKIYKRRPARGITVVLSLQFHKVFPKLNPILFKKQMIPSILSMPVNSMSLFKTANKPPFIAIFCECLNVLQIFPHFTTPEDFPCLILLTSSQTPTAQKTEPRSKELNKF